jgi:hypothetical protein
MPNVMNFTPARTPPVNFNKLRTRNEALRRRRDSIMNSGRTPVEPGKTLNTNENKVVTDIYNKNKNAYNKAKVGGKYKAQYIKSGNGLVASDFGFGERGAAIPYQVGSKNVTRRSSQKAMSDRDKAAAKRDSKRDAIERRMKQRQRSQNG